MGSFADIGMTYMFAVALAGLIVLTFMAAFARLFWKNRKLAKDQNKQDLEVAEKATQKAVMQETVLGEGDYFGVRAIERGYYGGVAQSPLASPGNSPGPSPAPTIRESIVPSIPLTTGPSLNIPELRLPGHRISRSLSNASSIKIPSSPKSLRLQPSDAELSGRRNHDSTVVRSTDVPKSLSVPETPADKKTVSENVSKAPLSPNARPILHRRVQSYAEWRLAPDMKRPPRSVPKIEVEPPNLAPQDGLRSSSLIVPPTSRPRSRSASMIGETNQLSSLQQELHWKRRVDLTDIVTLPAPATCKESTGRTVRFAGNYTPSQALGFKGNHTTTDTTTSNRANRSNIPHIKTGVTRSVTQDRRSKKTYRTNHGPSTHCRSDSGCELDMKPSLATAGNQYPERARSSSSSRSNSSSSSKSPRSSNDSSASSVRSKIEDHDEKLELISPVDLATSST